MGTRLVPITGSFYERKEVPATLAKSIAKWHLKRQATARQHMLQLRALVCTGKKDGLMPDILVLHTGRSSFFSASLSADSTVQVYARTR